MNLYFFICVLIFGISCNEKKNNSGPSSDPSANTEEDSAPDDEIPEPDKESDDDDDGNDDNDDDDAPVEAVTSVSGQVGSILLSGASDLQINAYKVNSDGSRGSLLGSGAVDGVGEFNMDVPAGIGTIELGLGSTGSSLTGGGEAFRSRIQPNSRTEMKATLSVFSEMAISRAEQLISSEMATPELAYQRANAETAATIGVTNFQEGTGDITQNDIDPSSDEARMAITMKAFKVKADESGKSDVAQKIVDSFKTSGNIGVVSLDDTTDLFDNYSNDLRSEMKDLVRGNSAKTISFNDIPVVNGYGGTVISSLNESDYEAYEAPEPFIYDHYMDWVLGPAATTTYTTMDDCLGPFILRRVDSFGETLSVGPELPIDLYANYYTDSSCSTGTTTMAIPLNQSDSSYVYYRPQTYMPISLSRSLNLGSETTDFEYLPLDAVMADGITPVAHMFSIELPDDPTVFPAWTYSNSGNLKTDCIPVAVALSRGGDIGAEFIQDITFTVMESTGIPGGTLDYYSDSDCTSSIATTENYYPPYVSYTPRYGFDLTISEGESYTVFYLKFDPSYSHSMNGAYFYIKIKVDAAIADTTETMHSMFDWNESRWVYYNP